MAERELNVEYIDSKIIGGHIRMNTFTCKRKEAYIVYYISTRSMAQLGTCEETINYI